MTVYSLVFSSRAACALSSPFPSIEGDIGGL